MLYAGMPFRHLRLLTLCLAATFLFVFSLAPAQTLLGLPIQGHTTPTSLKVWLMARGAKTAQVTLNGQTQTRDLKDQKAWQNHTPMTFEFNGLQPSTTYPLSIQLDDSILPQQYSLHTFSDQQGGPYSFMIGSCAFYGIGAWRAIRPGEFTHIYEAMSATPSDFFIWMGDNVYLLSGEWNSLRRTYEKYTKCRLEPRMNTFLSSRPQYAIGDDHDFGPDNSTGSFKNKDMTTACFKDFWPNPPTGTPNALGIFNRFSYRDSDFFLLDGRYYRDDISSEMYGPEQMQWLRDGLKNSTATFKFIVTGSQSLNQVSYGESWAHYPEHEEFINFLRDSKIKGVVFLSGDRHFTEMLRYQPDGMYPLYEVTSSPLTSILRRYQLLKSDPEYINPRRMEGTMLVKHNYGRLSIDGPPADRRCKIEIFGADGKIYWTREIAANELQ